MNTKDVKIWSLPIAKESPYLDIIEYVRFKNERSWYATINRNNNYYNLRLEIFDSELVKAIFLEY